MFVDVDGQLPDLFWDVLNVILDAKGLYETCREGNVKEAILEGLGMTYDVFAMCVPLLPSGVGLAVRSSTVADQAVDVLRAADNTSDAVETAVKAGKKKEFLKFNGRNFRENLYRLTGEKPETTQAHHIFPQKFRKPFGEKGIDIDDPHFGSWLESKFHNKNSYRYNEAWDDFFKNHPDATREDFLDYSKELMRDLYGQ